jgi:ketopantoate reductase
MIVVGAGRVGTALAKRSEAAGVAVELVTRDSGWSALSGPPGDPIVLTVRNDDLEVVIPRVPGHRRDDLVFVQNGMLRPWLRERALASCTRGVLWFAVPAKGDDVTLGGRDSPFCGQHALAMARWFVTIGLPARSIDWASFTTIELEKLIWNAAFGVLCDAYGIDVGTAAEKHRDELRALAAELWRVGRVSMGVHLDLDPLVTRLCAYSATIPTYRASIKEWRWRDGWFQDTARAYNIALPLHTALIEKAGKGHLLTPA